MFPPKPDLAHLPRERVFLQIALCLQLCTWLAGLWTHGTRSDSGGSTNLIERTVKKVCKAVLLVDLECDDWSSSVTRVSPESYSRLQILPPLRGFWATLVFPPTTVIERTGALMSLSLENQPGGPTVFPVVWNKSLGFQ